MEAGATRTFRFLARQTKQAPPMRTTGFWLGSADVVLSIRSSGDILFAVRYDDGNRREKISRTEKNQDRGLVFPDKE